MKVKKLIWTLVIVAIASIFGGRAWYLYQHQKEQQTNALNVAIVTFRGAFAKMGAGCGQWYHFS